MLKEKHEHVDKLPGVKLPEDIYIYNGSGRNGSAKRYARACRSFCIYQKHSKKHGTLCNREADYRVCGKGN